MCYIKVVANASASQTPPSKQSAKPIALKLAVDAKLLKTISMQNALEIAKNSTADKI